VNGSTGSPQAAKRAESAKGTTDRMAPYLDAPLEEFREYME